MSCSSQVFKEITFEFVVSPLIFSFPFEIYERKYACTRWVLTKRIEKKLNENCTRMLQAKLNKSWKQNSTKQQLYGQLPPISETIQKRRTRHARHGWRSTDELISIVFLWIPSHGRVSVGQPTRTYLQQLCINTGCSLKKTYWMQRMIKTNGERDIQWNPCFQHDHDHDDDDCLFEVTISISKIIVCKYFIYIHIYSDKNYFVSQEITYYSFA